MASLEALNNHLILNEVFHHLRCDDSETSPFITLVQCALVNRFWSKEAYRFLYKDVAINLGHNHYDPLCEDPFPHIHSTRWQFIASQIHRIRIQIFASAPNEVDPLAPILSELDYLTNLHFPRLRCLVVTQMLPRGSHEYFYQYVIEDSHRVVFDHLIRSPNLETLDIGETDFNILRPTIDFHTPGSLIRCFSQLKNLEVRIPWAASEPQYQEFQLLKECVHLEDFRVTFIDRYPYAQNPPSSTESRQATKTFQTVLEHVFGLPKLRGLSIKYDTILSGLWGQPTKGTPIRPPTLTSLDIKLNRDLMNWVLEQQDLSRMTEIYLTDCPAHSRRMAPIDFAFLTKHELPHLQHLHIFRNFGMELGELPSLRQCWYLPKSLSNISDSCSYLTTLNVVNIYGGFLEIGIDDDFIQDICRLSNLTHLDVEDEIASWTLPGLINLGLSCRNLEHLRIGGAVDITIPDFDDALRSQGIPIDSPSHTSTLGEASAVEKERRIPTNFNPLFPKLETLYIASMDDKSHELLNDLYPKEQFKRAPEAVVTHIQRRMDSHFPALKSLIRRGPLNSAPGNSSRPHLTMPIRRKRLTGCWPRNRLAYFISPWCSRIPMSKFIWKFHARNSGGIAAHWFEESDTASEIEDLPVGKRPEKDRPRSVNHPTPVSWGSRGRGRGRSSSVRGRAELTPKGHSRAKRDLLLFRRAGN